MPYPSLGRLDALLKRVSRSFYLSLKVLPRSVRTPIGLAYLFARAADTIADTRLLSPGERQRHLERFRSLFEQDDPTVLAELRSALVGPQHIPAERELLLSLDRCFAVLRHLDEADQLCIRRLLLTLTLGMLMDLSTFPQEHEGRLVALQTRADLDRYTYYVAGCVGEFWTEMYVAHRPSLVGWDLEAMQHRGTRFGQGLQMTNILRDLPRDLRMGRCYIPLEALTASGLAPEDLLHPASIARARPVLHELLALTLEHYRHGWAYTLAIPRREVRMRLACTWPLLIGLRTLRLIAGSDNLLNPATTLKIPRHAVYRILLLSSLVIGSDRGLTWYGERLTRHLSFFLDIPPESVP